MNIMKCIIYLIRYKIWLRYALEYERKLDDEMRFFGKLKFKLLKRIGMEEPWM